MPFSYGYDHDHHDHSSDPIFSALRSFYNSKTSSRPSYSMWPLPVIHITSDMANLVVPVSHWRRLNKSVPQILLSHLSTTQSFDRGALRDLQFCSQLSLEDGSVHSTHQSQIQTWQTKHIPVSCCFIPAGVANHRFLPGRLIELRIRMMAGLKIVVRYLRHPCSLTGIRLRS